MITTLPRNALNRMLDDLKQAPAIYQPSKFWDFYIDKNLAELNEFGIENFKQTINRNYFNWTGWECEQHRKNIKLPKYIEKLAIFSVFFAQDIGTRPDDLSRYYWRRYREYVALLWEYTKQQDSLGLLKDIAEPLIGNPFTFRYKGRLISQDICNSVLELNSIGNRIRTDGNVLEIGGGYGRIAQVLLKNYSNIKITMVDIPPAIYIAQWYLPQVCRNKKIFHYRKFDNFADVLQEYEAADIRFLLPHQVELLPDKSFDLCINVSSFHEMTREQVKHWFETINRITNGYLYSKQWIESVNKLDDLLIKRDEYPDLPYWKTILNRQCVIQDMFFEALYTNLYTPGED